MVARAVKKGIVKDWSVAFLDLYPYTQNKLYKILGPFIVGVEISNIPRSEDYRPYFICFPMWKSDFKNCFEEPVFLQQIRNRKSLQFSIPYVKHDAFFQEAVECVKVQVPILLQGEVTLKQLLYTIDKQFSQTLIKSSPVGQAKLWEAKLFAALYMNDLEILKEIWEALIEASRTWIPELFEWRFGKLELWLQGLQRIMVNREAFMKQIEVNKQDKGAAKLRVVELAV